MLPASLRAAPGHPVDRRPGAVRFALLAAVSRAASPAMVGPLREFGPVYVRMRRRPLARGDVARRSTERSAAAA